MIVGFIARHGDGFVPVRLAANDSNLAEQVLPTRMNRQPLPQDAGEEGRERHPAVRPLSLAPLLLADEDGLDA